MNAVTAADHFQSTRLPGAGFRELEVGVGDKLEPAQKVHEDKAK